MNFYKVVFKNKLNYLRCIVKIKFKADFTKIPNHY